MASFLHLGSRHPTPLTYTLCLTLQLPALVHWLLLLGFLFLPIFLSLQALTPVPHTHTHTPPCLGFFFSCLPGKAGVAWHGAVAPYRPPWTGGFLAEQPQLVWDWLL